MKVKITVRKTVHEEVMKNVNNEDVTNKMGELFKEYPEHHLDVHVYEVENEE